MVSGLFQGGFEGHLLEPKTSAPIVDSDGTKIDVDATALNALLAGESVQAITATDDGLTTGIITGDQAITTAVVTSANAAHIVTLPAPTPGRVVILAIGANGCELRSSAPATVGIGGNTPGSGHESALAANSMAIAVCISATMWLGLEVAAETASAIETAA